jgi:predicted secreted protein
MALYTGVTGKIAVNGGTAPVDVVHMSGWTVDKSRNMITGEYLGQDHEETTPGTKKWTASFNGTADFATASGQKDLDDAYENGTEVEASFYLDENTFFQGNAFIESLSITHEAGNKAEISISLVGNGGNTLTLPAPLP